jgi:hypothetical protein
MCFEDSGLAGSASEQQGYLFPTFVTNNMPSSSRVKES